MGNTSCVFSACHRRKNYCEDQTVFIASMSLIESHTAELLVLKGSRGWWVCIMTMLRRGDGRADRPHRPQESTQEGQVMHVIAI